MKAIRSVDSPRLARRAYRPRHAFDIDPKRPQRYRLRLSRYMVLAQDLSDWAGAAALAGRTLSVLDVGCGWGPLLCQLEGEPHFANIRMSACDVTEPVLYKKELYQEFFIGDLTRGYPGIGSERYDVVVCEQVLEHLDSLETAIATLLQMTRPGGLLVIGVPIFFPPLHLARKHLVPRFARILRHPETASHLQAFSLFSFLRLLRALPQPQRRAGARVSHYLGRLAAAAGELSLVVAAEPAAWRIAAGAVHRGSDHPAQIDGQLNIAQRLQLKPEHLLHAVKSGRPADEPQRRAHGAGRVDRAVGRAVGQR